MLENIGYIEGFYGKLLTWSQRKSIIKNLSELNFNSYFYAPKEDIRHRFDWRKKYPKIWLRSFQNFCNYANSKNINIIIGISPGLDFDFTYKNDDFTILKNKLQMLEHCGAKSLVILYDDIEEKSFQNKSEGKLHAELCNKLSAYFKKPLIVVPRVYSDEIEDNSQNYLDDFLDIINDNFFIFYTGKTIISSNVYSKNRKINDKLKDDKLIYWCNYFSNDYCPKRIFLGPPPNFKISKNFMFNLTGLINIDIIILKIIHGTMKSKNIYEDWKKIILDQKIPEEFLKVYKFFEKPYFEETEELMNYKFDNKIIDALDILLWKWKSPLSIELYPYLFNLKQDIQILMKQLDNKRILKTQTHPLQRIFLKEE